MKSEARIPGSTAVGICILNVRIQLQMRWALTLKGLESDKVHKTRGDFVLVVFEAMNTTMIYTNPPRTF